MNEKSYIAPPMDDTDTSGAQRVLEEFAQMYQPVILSAQNQLSHVITHMQPEYAAAYKPWQSALQDISRGIHLLRRNIPLKDMQRFIDALYMFTFEGAVQFLYDLCRSCKISLQRNWEKQFREHIDMLLFALSILNRELAPVHAR